MLSSKNPADAVMKLVDLGCAHMKQPQQQDQQQSKNDQNKERRMSTASTPAYCPPEVLRDMRQNRRPSIDPSFDAWSLGVILYTMLVGLHPFDINSQASNEEIEQAVLSGEKPPLRGFKYARHLSEDAISLIENLMHHDPHRRLTAEQLLENRWVRGETASSQKIAGSDKRLALYRKYKTKIGSTFFKMLLNQTDAIHQQHHQHYGTNSDKSKTTERLSVLESAFRRLDTKKNGYLTTKDMLTGNNNHEQEPQDDEPSSSKSGFFAFLTDQQQDSDKDSDTQLSFSDLSSLLAESMKNRYFPNEHVVYNAGDKGDSMYLINSGTVQVTSPDGITMTRQSGEVFGEEVMMQKEGKNDASSGSGSSSSSTSANITYRTSVKCITPVHVLEIPRHLYTKYVSSDEETFLSMAETDRHRRREHANAIVRLNTEAKTKHLQRNDTIFCAGQRGNALYLVADGTVDIFVQDGHKVRTLQPGEMTGEHAAYFYKPYNVTAQCVSDSCQVQAIPASVLHKLFESNPAFRSNFRDLMVRRDFKKAVCAAIGRTFPTTEEEIRSAFDVIDLDKSGEVDLEALRTLVQKFDSNYDEKYIQEMLESLDLNKSGTLTWAEFYRIFAMDKES